MSVSFHETELELTIDLAVGFSQASVALTRNGAATVAANATVAYSVRAYQCGGNGEDQDQDPSPLTQNSVLNLCVRTNSEDVEIEAVQGLKLTQVDSDGNAVETGVTFYAIGTADDENSGQVSALVNYDPVVQGDSQPRLHLVQTRVISSFFALSNEEDAVKDIVASGQVLLKFAGRRRLLHFDNRVLQNSVSPTAGFAVMVSLEETPELSQSEENEVSSAVLLSGLNACILCALMGSLM
jgi:hypothetical protein